MVALALAAERARHFVEVGARLVAAIAPVKAVLLDPRDYFSEKRKDPEWGWERARWN